MAEYPMKLVRSVRSIVIRTEMPSRPVQNPLACIWLTANHRADMKWNTLCFAHHHAVAEGTAVKGKNAVHEANTRLSRECRLNSGYRRHASRILDHHHSLLKEAIPTRCLVLGKVQGSCS